MNDFSRLAAQVLNAPYWYANYTGTDPDKCIHFYSARAAEKSMLTAECTRVEQNGADLEMMEPRARQIWDKAYASMASNQAEVFP